MTKATFLGCSGAAEAAPFPNVLKRKRNYKQ